MQTGKQVITAAIEFKTPDRLPVIFDTLGISDTRGIGWNQIGTGDHTQKHTYDEWGCGWSRSHVKNMGLVNEHPLDTWAVSYTHLRAHETRHDLVCRLLLEKKKK